MDNPQFFNHIREAVEKSINGLHYHQLSLNAESKFFIKLATIRLLKDELVVTTQQDETAATEYINIYLDVRHEHI